MLILETLTLEGFGPFNEKTVIHFPPNGAILIRGQMVNEAISSGTGKSHIMKGIAYALGYCDVSATELKGWDSKKFSVVLSLRDTVTNEVSIISRNPSLSVVLNGVPVAGTATASEEALQLLLKLPKDLRSALTYRAQREKGAFLNNTDAQNKEFFTTLLELDKLEAVADLLDNENKKIDSDMLTNITKIKSLEDTIPLLQVKEGELESQNENINESHKKIALFQEEISASQTNITTLNSTVNNLLGSISDLEKKIDIMKEEKAMFIASINNDNLKAQRAALEVKKRQYIDASEAFLKEKVSHQKEMLGKQANKVTINQQLGLVEMQRKELIRIKDDAAKLNEEIKRMEGEVASCPTCSQPWDNAKTHLETKKVQLQALMTKFQTAQKFITENENLGDKIPDLDNEIMLFSQLMQECEENSRKQQEPINQITAEIMALDNESRDLLAPVAAKDQLISSTQQQIIHVNQQITTVKQTATSFNQQIKTATDQINSQYAFIKQYEQFIKDLDTKRANYAVKVTELENLHKKTNILQDEKSVADHCSKILSRGGFLSVIFDEVLADIEARSNIMIACIPNINRFTIAIVTSGVTKGGKAEKKIKVLIYKNGREVSLKNLSGGQLCALELCTDFAVRECIRLRSGSPFGWVCLDEAMDGLDVETKKPALEMLTEMVTGQLLIIDHSTEIKEGFESIITVEYDGKYSRIL